MTDLTTTPPTQPGDELISAVRDAVARVVERDPAEIGPASQLFDDLGLDSTSALELLMEIESSLDVEFDFDTLEQHHFFTVRSLAGYVQSQMDGTPCS